MTAVSLSADKSPVLRTLSPALRGLERSMRGYLDGPHRIPLAMMTRAALEGLANDLHRQADALDVDKPLLVVMLMGGTGVGKSTLLNALAGGNIAQASFARPTTRDPVVYYHESLRSDKLDPALRHCRLVTHDRSSLIEKVLVDTPDVDSNDLTNREKLLRLLPVADVVLYCGSQEKYHDQLVWQLFLQQRKRRAFAFVLNKWDRCLHSGAAGMRPDEDLANDLTEEGFQSPLIFRTCAQYWVDKATGVQPQHELPEGEQFLDLVNWLEAGLTRLEIEAIKTRGVGQLLHHTQETLREAAPPELTEQAERTRKAWGKPLTEEASAIADVLVNTLEPYQKEIEHHFSLQGHRRFRGIMGWYLQAAGKIKYAGSHLRERIPFVSRSRQQEVERPASWDLSMFTNACTDVASSRELDARTRALVNKLLVEADVQGYPLNILTDPVEALTTIDWRTKWARSLSDVLDKVERQWTQPTGARKWIQTTLVILGDWIPPLALLGSLGMMLYRHFNPWSDDNHDFRTIDALLPFIILFAVLLMLHLLISILLPLRWGAIRDEFHKQLEVRVKEELEQIYLAVPEELAEKLKEERRRVEKLIEDTREVATWLTKREQSASIAGLYGQ